MHKVKHIGFWFRARWTKHIELCLPGNIVVKLGQKVWELLEDSQKETAAGSLEEMTAARGLLNWW